MPPKIINNPFSGRSSAKFSSSAQFSPNYAQISSNSQNKKFSSLLILLLISTILVIIFINIFLPQDSDGRFLSAHSSKPNGANALTTILTNHGVELFEVTAQDQLAKIPSQSTVVIVNPDQISEKDIATLQESGAQILLLVHQYGYFLPNWGINAITISANDSSKNLQTPDIDTKDLSTTKTKNSPFESPQNTYFKQHQNGETLFAKCDFSPATIAQKIAPIEYLFQDYENSKNTCFWKTNNSTSNSRVSAALINAPENPRIFAFSAPIIFSNTFLKTEGNAAFALNFLGKYQQIYWIENYHTPHPNQGNADFLENASIPAWISISGISLSFIGIWWLLYRARRFGKLVAEPMPVVVPSSESDFGRAQLYAQSKDYPYLARVLRNNFLYTYGSKLTGNSWGNSPNLTHANKQETVKQIIDSLQSHTGFSPEFLNDLLFNRKISSKTDLCKLHTELASLAKELS